jgi:hypothetical protein
MKMVLVKAVRLAQVDRRYVKNLNAENKIQNIWPLDSQTLMLMEKKTRSFYFVWKFLMLTALYLVIV